MSEPADVSLNGQFLSDFNRLQVARSRRIVTGEELATHILQFELEQLATPELILGGESNLLPFHFLRTGDRVGRAVVKIRRGDGACGTGFMVAPDILLTNHHVLPERATAEHAWAMANYEVEVAGHTNYKRVNVALAPDSLFVNEPALDFAFCAVFGLEHLGVIAMDRATTPLAPNNLVNIIQHPRGRLKEVAIQENHLVKADRVILHYACDTEPGSSGSPVFDNEWKLLALHHASLVSPDGLSAQGGKANEKYLNEGIRISAICHWLETNEAIQQLDPVKLNRLRSLF